MFQGRWLMNMLRLSVAYRNKFRTLTGVQESDFWFNGEEGADDVQTEPPAVGLRPPRQPSPQYGCHLGEGGTVITPAPALFCRFT